MLTFTLDLAPIGTLTDEQFWAICQANRDWQFERNAKGELIVVTPVGGEGGSQALSLGSQLWLWNQQTKLGVAFSSSTLFKLDNGALRSPDAAWVRLAHWQVLTPEEQAGFPPLCPDFVIELRSPSDRLKSVQDKMQEYLENGLRLGWLIDPQNQQVEIYRPGQPVQIVPLPANLSGEDVLPGFILAWS
jgi:Uma2 family endonuclease